jgi:hypothetical protein
MVACTMTNKRNRIFLSAAPAFFRMKGYSNVVFNFHVSHTYMLLLFRNYTFPLKLSPNIHIAHAKLHQVTAIFCRQNAGKSCNIKENVGNFEFLERQGKIKIVLMR